MSDVICVVRVGTSGYRRGSTYHYTKTVRVMRTLTYHDLMADECDAIGVQDAFENITNLYTVDDGLYNLVPCNVSYDVESGHLDDWNLKLVPYRGDSA